MPVQLLDAMGRPVPDAEIGFALGCGHTPNVRSARTGADGVAPLTGINPTRSFGNNTIRDLYPVSPVVDGNYVSLTWLPGDGPYRLQKPPGTMSSGRVVDANGKPLAGAWVGEPDMHRGPWTKTDIEGEFVLLGRRGFSRFLLVEELAGRPLLDFEAPPKTPLTVRVVPEGTAPRPQGQLTVRLRLDNGHAFGHCTLRATALVHSDDYEGLLEFDAAGTAIANLPIGDVVIWGQPTPDCEPIERIVPVTAAGNELAIAVAKRPTIRVPLVNMPEDVAISVVTMDEPARDVTEDLRNGHAFAVPAAEPFAFVMRRNRTERFMRRDRTAHFIYCESAAQARGQQLSWPAPMRINTRIVDAAGKPVAANVQCNRMMVPMSKTKRGWQTCQSDGTVSFTTHGQGAMMLHVQPVDPALRPRTRALQIPAFEPGREIRIGPTALHSRQTPLLRCLDARGQPLAHGNALLLRHGLSLNGKFADDGGWDLLDPRAGDTFLVDLTADEGDGVAYAPLRQQLQGQGPWTLRVPTGGVRLAFVDDRQQPLEGVTLCVGDQVLQDLPSAFELRGLPAGRHELAVGHPDRAACSIDLVVAQQLVDMAIAVPAR